MHRIIAVIPVTWVGEVFGYEKRRSIAYLLMPVPQHPKGDMTQTPISVAERRLAIARRLYEALVDQDPDRAITLCDSSGRVVTHHYPQPGRGLRIVSSRPGSSEIG
jgi:hypothetical protein